MYLSIVIPVYNEAKSIPILIEKLYSDLKALDIEDYEIIFVDDGSTDSSFKTILSYAKNDKRIKTIKFRRNFGKTIALSAAFVKTSGELVLTMDADLQDDSAELSKLLDKLNEGYDLVVGWKKYRKDNVIKRLSSKLFNLLVSSVMKLKLHDYNCGLKLYRSQVIKEIDIYGDLHRFIPALAHQLGFKITEVPVNHHERLFDESKFGKYGIRRVFSGLFDVMTVFFLSKYTTKPLHLFGLIGFLLSAICAMIFLGLEIRKYLFDIQIGAGRPFIMLLTSGMVMGLQIIIFGFLGEMLSRLNARNEKSFSIEELVNFEEKKGDCS